MSKKSYRKTYLYLWLLLALGLAVVCGISFYDDPRLFGLGLSQGTFPDVILAPEGQDGGSGPGTFPAGEEESESGPVTVAETDTTVRSVLIFGDSMTILVANRLAAYGEKNGYEVASVTWDGSSSISWSSCDTLENYIARYRPDFIMVTLGSNELFLKNFDKRKPFVEKLIAKIGDIPFVWIGPPNWKEDVGFNAMMRSTLPRGTFFDSNGLDLPRGADRIHPTPRGGIIWTDSIMRWIAGTPHPILAEAPSPGIGTRSHHSHYFKAGGKGGNASPSSPSPAPDAGDGSSPAESVDPVITEPSPAPVPESVPAADQTHDSRE